MSGPSSSYRAFLWDDCCHLYTSNNEGTSWTESETPSLTGEWDDMQMAILDGDYATMVAFVNEYLGNLYETRAELSTASGGTGTWNLLNPMGSAADGTVNHFQQFLTGAISNGAAIILALPGIWADSALSYPRISRNNGSTWSDVTSLGAGRWWLRACFNMGATVMYMSSTTSSGFGGTLHVSKSTDSGASWVDVTAPSTGAVEPNNHNQSNLRCSSDGTKLLYVSTWDNNIYLSTNSGATWTTIAPPVPAGVTQADFVNNGSNWASCGMSANGQSLIVAFADVLGAGGYAYNSYVATSLDGGTTWTIQKTPGLLANPTTAEVMVSNVSPDGFAFIVAYEDTITGTNYSADISIDGAAVSWANSTGFGSTVLGNDFTAAYIVPTGSAPAQGYVNIVVGLPYCASYLSTKLAYAAQRGTAINLVKKVDHIGFVLQNTHFQGLRYGPYNLNPVRWPTAFSPDFSPDFDTSANLFRDQNPPLDNLPLVEKGAPIPENLIWEFYDNVRMEWAGNSESDPRIYLQACSPRPCTVVAVSFHIETDE